MKNLKTVLVLMLSIIGCLCLKSKCEAADEYAGTIKKTITVNYVDSLDGEANTTYDETDYTYVKDMFATPGSILLYSYEFKLDKPGFVKLSAYVNLCQELTGGKVYACLANDSDNIDSQLLVDSYVDNRSLYNIQVLDTGTYYFNLMCKSMTETIPVDTPSIKVGVDVKALEDRTGDNDGKTNTTAIKILNGKPTVGYILKQNNMPSYMQVFQLSLKKESNVNLDIAFEGLSGSTSTNTPIINLTDANGYLMNDIELTYDANKGTYSLNGTYQAGDYYIAIVSEDTTNIRVDASWKTKVYKKIKKLKVTQNKLKLKIKTIKNASVVVTINERDNYVTTNKKGVATVELEPYLTKGTRIEVRVIKDGYKQRTKVTKFKTV